MTIVISQSSIDNICLSAQSWKGTFSISRTDFWTPSGEEESKTFCCSFGFPS